MIEFEMLCQGELVLFSKVSFLERPILGMERAALVIGEYITNG